MKSYSMSFGDLVDDERLVPMDLYHKFPQMYTDPRRCIIAELLDPNERTPGHKIIALDEDWYGSVSDRCRYISTMILCRVQPTLEDDLPNGFIVGMDEYDPEKHIIVNTHLQLRLRYDPSRIVTVLEEVYLRSPVPALVVGKTYLVRQRVSSIDQKHQTIKILTSYDGQPD